MLRNTSGHTPITAIHPTNGRFVKQSRLPTNKAQIKKRSGTSHRGIRGLAWPSRLLPSTKACLPCDSPKPRSLGSLGEVGVALRQLRGREFHGRPRGILAVDAAYLGLPDSATVASHRRC